MLNSNVSTLINFVIEVLITVVDSGVLKDGTSDDREDYLLHDLGLALQWISHHSFLGSTEELLEFSSETSFVALQVVEVRSWDTDMSYFLSDISFQVSVVVRVQEF